MKTGDLTGGERAVLHRRRAQASQREAADEHEVSLYRYRLWEADEEDPPPISLGRLRPHEVCFIRRRRAGVSLADLAGAMGVSEWWLTKMEYGREPAHRLVEHWAGTVCAI